MIPLYKPYISNKEISEVIRVIKTGVLTRGPEVLNFEKDFSKYTKQKYSVSVNSGTSGLHLAVRAMGWGRGDEVITTPFSYIASANVLLFEGITPVFVDIDLDTLNIDTKKIEEKITSKTKGILLVHILGLPVNHKDILILKNKYGLGIVEDACESIGRPSSRFPVTLAGDISVYGFHENKQITSGGEGGMITTNNYLLAEKCRSMMNQGRSAKKDWINNVILGFNYRMTELQAAFGRVQLAKVDRIIRRRKEIAISYLKLLKDIKGLRLYRDKNRSWFLFFVLFDDPHKRIEVYNQLAKQNISSSINYFPSIYKFPMYSKFKTKCVNSDYVSERLLALPTFHEIRNKDIKLITDIIKNVLESK